MATYYAVSNVGGPVSVRLAATTKTEALAEFEAGQIQNWIDEARTGAEDDLDICGDGMDEETFETALIEAGCEPAQDLSPVANYHAGTAAHLAGGWYLWVRR